MLGLDASSPKDASFTTIRDSWYIAIVCIDYSNDFCATHEVGRATKLKQYMKPHDRLRTATSNPLTR